MPKTDSAKNEIAPEVRGRSLTAQTINAHNKPEES